MKPADMTKTIDLINAEIRPFDQKIALYEFGLTNDEFYVFYSTAKTSISKLQNSYNEAELDFFKLILTKIVKHEQLNIAPIDALNLCTAITGAKLNKLRAQKLLANWIQSKYFFQHDDNKIYLGPKVLYEFSELLQGMELNYLKSCLLCEAIAAWVRSSKLFTQFEADFSYFPIRASVAQVVTQFSTRRASASSSPAPPSVRAARRSGKCRKLPLLLVMMISA